MSVRINLLPEATKQRDRAAQQRSLAALAGVALLAGLGGVHLWQSSQVNQAEDELLAAQAVSSELRGDQAELVAFEELADRHDRSGEVLTTALSGEVSVAGVLQDLALVIPADTQLDSFAVNIPVVPDPASSAVGTLTLTGKTLTAHAPGVERLLLSLDKVAGFRESYLNSSTLDENEDRIATFSLDTQIGPEAETRRYADGLPEVLR